MSGRLALPSKTKQKTRLSPGLLFGVRGVQNYFESWVLRKSTLPRTVSSVSIMFSTVLMAWMTVPWVAAAEGLADLLQGMAGEVAREVHGDLARERDGVGPALAGHVGMPDLVMVGDALLNALDVEPVLRLLHQHVLEERLGGGQVERLAVSAE